MPLAYSLAPDWGVRFCAGFSYAPVCNGAERGIRDVFFRLKREVLILASVVLLPL
jgi:hypothetical protein